MSTQPAVQIEALSHSYGAKQALQEVSFSVGEGEIFGLLGPNGGGKTTLFRILSTLLAPTTGRAAIFGCDVVRDARQVRERIGVVFQSQNLDVKLTAAENLRHQGHLYGLHGRLLRARIESALTRLGLTERQNERVEKLSGGLRRRVELAKGLLHHPGLLLLDEPSTGLDPGARRSLWDYLTVMRAEEGVTVLLTTHLLEEADKCDRLAILDAGQTVASGTPDSLRKEIGAEVILMEAREPETLRQQLRQRFSIEASILDGRVRFEHPSGHQFIPQLVEAFPGEIQSVMVAKPTLEDVFIRRTGHRLFADATAPNGAGN
ncbi:MAG: ABC transporter ATP-binding protein [Acidobacteria bacterium RIFCSPLOWO2_02_FULL_59_13]|nr:MAG: ABC transporter ATP-binding protein [Acidobacteria bacterium RIFCSPLOWO2_02_FULL_59_13]